MATCTREIPNQNAGAAAHKQGARRDPQVTTPSPTAQKAAPPNRTMDDELERFKRDVNLTELAATLGYGSSIASGRPGESGVAAPLPASRCATLTPTTKSSSGRDRDGHWTYFSIRRRQATTARSSISSSAEARRASAPSGSSCARGCMRTGRPFPSNSIGASVADPEARRSGRGRGRMRASACRAQPLPRRALHQPATSQLDPRFADSYRVGDRGNVLFPHIDPATRAGRRLRDQEPRLHRLRLPAAGRPIGSSASASRRRPPRPRRDRNRRFQLPPALSAPSARATSAPAAPSVPRPSRSSARAIAAMPAGADIVSATDADEGGEKLHKQLERRRRPRASPPRFADCRRTGTTTCKRRSSDHNLIEGSTASSGEGDTHGKDLHRRDS